MVMMVYIRTQYGHFPAVKNWAPTDAVLKELHKVCYGIFISFYNNSEN